MAHEHIRTGPPPSSCCQLSPPSTKRDDEPCSGSVAFVCWSASTSWETLPILLISNPVHHTLWWTIPGRLRYVQRFLLLLVDSSTVWKKLVPQMSERCGVQPVMSSCTAVVKCCRFRMNEKKNLHANLNRLVMSLDSNWGHYYELRCMSSTLERILHQCRPSGIFSKQGLLKKIVAVAKERSVHTTQ